MKKSLLLLTIVVAGFGSAGLSASYYIDTLANMMNGKLSEKAQTLFLNKLTLQQKDSFKRLLNLKPVSPKPSKSAQILFLHGLTQFQKENLSRLLSLKAVPVGDYDARLIDAAKKGYEIIVQVLMLNSGTFPYLTLKEAYDSAVYDSAEGKIIKDILKKEISKRENAINDFLQGEAAHKGHIRPSIGPIKKHLATSEKVKDFNKYAEGTTDFSVEMLKSILEKYKISSKSLVNALELAKLKRSKLVTSSELSYNEEIIDLIQDELSELDTNEVNVSE